MDGNGLEQRVERVVAAAQDRKAEDLVALDARGVASFADAFVLATGNSDRHARSIADGIREALAAGGERPLGMEGYDDGRWVLIDFGDVIVHIFQREVREYYDLERLWSEAPALEITPDDARRAGP